MAGIALAGGATDVRKLPMLLTSIEFTGQNGNALKTISVCEKMSRKTIFLIFLIMVPFFQELGLKICEYSREKPSNWLISMQSVVSTF